MANEEKNILHSFYGSKDFVKVKQCLEIGKIVFSFVTKNNPKNFLDCYLEAEEFGALLMADIRNGTLLRKLLDEKSQNRDYPKAVWTSPIGGNATGNNGSPISRYFTISPGSTAEILITGRSYPATQNQSGAFIPEKGASPLQHFMVGCSYSDLKILQYKWSFLEQDYMRSKYTCEKMQDDYWKNSSDSKEAATNTSNAPSVSTHHSADDPKNTSGSHSYTAMEVETLTPLQPFGSRGFLCFKAADKKNNSYAMIIDPATVSSFDQKKWLNFKKQAEKASGIRKTFYTIKHGNRILVKGIA